MNRYYPKPRGFGNRELNQPVKVMRDRIKRGRQAMFNRHNHKKHKGEPHMEITFDRIEETSTNPNAQNKTYKIIRIFGTALTGKLTGQEYSTQIFASAKDMANVIRGAKKGDRVEIKMKQNGNYWNPESISIMAPETGGNTSVSQSAPAVGQSVENPRLNNLSMAIDLMGPKGKMDATKYLVEAAGVADLIQDYVDKKGAFQFDKDTATNGIPDEDIPPLPED